ncbi:MAG: UTP--glucose-1-phosphate uridylyltransferase GalU [Candidatus Woesearchaeota archaeon]
MRENISKCVFPAAGYGTRFLPATKAIPKEMLPIVDTPLIEYGVREAKEAGLNDIVIVTGRGKSAIENHFDRSFELESQLRGTSKEALLNPINSLIEDCNFGYTRQGEMKGLGHAVLQSRHLVGDVPFGVVLADDFCVNSSGKGVMGQLRDAYEETGKSVIALMQVPREDVSKYGVITPSSSSSLEGRLIDVSDMVEKPDSKNAPSNYAVIGRYILTPEIFDILKQTPAGKGGEIQLTDALKVQAQEGNLLGLEFEGRRFDCGSINGYVDATNFEYQRRF